MRHDAADPRRSTGLSWTRSCFGRTSRAAKQAAKKFGKWILRSCLRNKKRQGEDHGNQPGKASPDRLRKHIPQNFHVDNIGSQPGIGKYTGNPDGRLTLCRLFVSIHFRETGRLRCDAA